MTTRLSPRLIRAFQDGCRASFGVELGHDEAEEAAMRLLRVMKIVATVDARRGQVDELKEQKGD